MNLTLGAFIAALRKEKGLTQRELSEMLCVSDKTVSHWERDETSPDISLLPLIADIFGITVDELLKGERKEAARVSEPLNTEEAEKNNTGLLYALSIAFNKFRTKNYMSVALSVIAVFCGLIADYFKSVDVGYLVFIAVLTVPFLLTALFRGNFSSHLVSPYIDKTVLKDYSKKANRITLCCIYFTLLCFILYSARGMLFYADIILVLLIFLASGALVILCERTLRKNDLVSTSDKPVIIKKTSLLKLLCCFLCFIFLFIGTVSHSSVHRESIIDRKAEYTAIPEEEFIAFMEKDVPPPEELYNAKDFESEFSPADKGTEYTFYSEFGFDNTVIQTLDPDYDGEITFVYNNLEIARYRYLPDEGFRVYTHAQLLKAEAEAEKEITRLNIIHFIYYPSVILIFVGLYFILKRFLLKNRKTETLTLKLF